MSSPRTRRGRRSRGSEPDTSSDLAMMPPTSPARPSGQPDTTSDPVTAPQTPGNLSEIDLSSPLFYGTPGSARTPGGSTLTPGRTPRGAQTPVSDVYFADFS